MDGADEPEKLDCHFSTHHPRPLAVGHRVSTHVFSAPAPWCPAGVWVTLPASAHSWGEAARTVVDGKVYPEVERLQFTLERPRRKGQGSHLVIIL